MKPRKSKPARRPSNRSPEHLARMRRIKAEKQQAAKLAEGRPDIVGSVINEMNFPHDSPMQLAILRSYYGLPLTEAALGMYRQSSGNAGYAYEGRPPSELNLLCGAQSGKTGRVAAPIAVYE